MLKPRLNPPLKLTPAKARQLFADERLFYRSGGGDISIGIITPNPYKEGIVGLSSHILMRLCLTENAFVERYYLDVPGEGLRSLESARPLSEQEILFASVSYEPDLLVLAGMLNAGGVPPIRRERAEGDPLVILGGAAVMGAPALAAEIGDFVAWGEAEVLTPQIIGMVKTIRGQKREVIVDGLQKLQGSSGEVKTENNTWQYYKSFSDNPGYSMLSTPHGEFGDSFLIEAVRGCPHGCPHCFACRVQTPFRPARNDVIQKIIEERSVKKIGLVGLGVSDHPDLIVMLEAFHRKGYKLAIASLTAEQLSVDALRLIVAMGQKTLTISPEAGSERLRKSLGKMAEEDEWVKVTSNAWDAGFRSLRLYFMIGLPGESDEDLLAVGALVHKIGMKFRARIAVTLAPFVPKPRTPWSDVIPCGLKEYERRLRVVKGILTGCIVRTESPREAVWQWELSQLDSKGARSVLKDYV